MTVKIIADSTCDLPKALVDQYDIYIVPTYINIGDESMIDGKDFTPAEFYQNLPNYPQPPKTAAPAPGIFAEAYDQAGKAGANEVVSLHVSSKLSAFTQSARLGADMSNVNTSVFDSLTVSMGLGLLTLQAAKMAQSGASATDILTQLNASIGKAHVFFAVDDLIYLKRGGRISWGQAQLGSLLNIKPILGTTATGEVKPLEKVRTRKKVIPKLVEMTNAYGELAGLSVMYGGDNEADAQALKQELAAHYSGEIIITTVGPAIGTHTGPGVLGVGLLQK